MAEVLVPERPFTDPELEALLMQPIKITRPVEWSYYIRGPERLNCTPGVVYEMLLERLELNP